MRQSELKISEANVGAILPECIACPDNNRDQPANEHRRVLGANSFVNKFVCRRLTYAKSLIFLTSPVDFENKLFFSVLDLQCF